MIALSHQGIGGRERADGCTDSDGVDSEVQLNHASASRPSPWYRAQEHGHGLRQPAQEGPRLDRSRVSEISTEQHAPLWRASRSRKEVLEPDPDSASESDDRAGDRVGREWVALPAKASIRARLCRRASSTCGLVTVARRGAHAQRPGRAHRATLHAAGACRSAPSQGLRQT